LWFSGRDFVNALTPAMVGIPKRQADRPTEHAVMPAQASHATAQRFIVPPAE